MRWLGDAKKVRVTVPVLEECDKKIVPMIKASRCGATVTHSDKKMTSP